MFITIDHNTKGKILEQLKAIGLAQLEDPESVNKKVNEMVKREEIDYSSPEVIYDPTAEEIHEDKNSIYG